MGEGWTGGASDKAESTGEDPRTTGGLVSGARPGGKRRGFSPAAAARHRSRTRVPTVFFLVFSTLCCGSRVFFWIFFSFFVNSDVSLIRNLKSDTLAAVNKAWIFIVVTVKTLGLCPFSGLACDLLPRRQFHGSPKAHCQKSISVTISTVTISTNTALRTPELLGAFSTRVGGHHCLYATFWVLGS